MLTGHQFPLHLSLNNVVHLCQLIDGDKLGVEVLRRRRRRVARVGRRVGQSLEAHLLQYGAYLSCDMI